MAARKRSSTRRTVSRRRSTARRRTHHRNPVRTARRRHATVSRRRRTHHRNPKILAVVKETAIDTAMVLGGSIGGNMVAKLLPVMGNPWLEAAKGTAVAVGVRMLGDKFVGRDKARFLGAGAMQPVLKQLIITLAPASAPFLADYESVGAYLPVGDPYQDGGYLAGEVIEPEVAQGIGSYMMN